MKKPLRTTITFLLHAMRPQKNEEEVLPVEVALAKLREAEEERNEADKRFYGILESLGLYMEPDDRVGFK